MDGQVWSKFGVVLLISRRLSLALERAIVLISLSATPPHILEGEACRTSSTRDAVVMAMTGVCDVAGLNAHVFTCCLKSQRGTVTGHPG